MRAGTYYAVAGALLLATLPMYRYIYQQAHGIGQNQSHGENGRALYKRAMPETSDTNFPEGSVADARMGCGGCHRAGWVRPNNDSMG
ncbi:hypothetical protein ASD22_03405 [Rhodanobacter sp. Root480]|jgi:hypothetical protein|uniref:hypothetical protein n=1 Tax=Rhodanobacter sp. Root480 TaxID=1736542 RepID=UPI0006FD28B4|nr:hypothetical protein [Rhodanobacter sp. Root480]KQX99323.1 hypothetical protein ASD22_03405 [Rhodanobacter sp. Root480]